jgi:hypothetical protein
VGALLTTDKAHVCDELVTGHLVVGDEVDGVSAFDAATNTLRHPSELLALDRSQATLVSGLEMRWRYSSQLFSGDRICDSISELGWSHDGRRLEHGAWSQGVLWVLLAKNGDQGQQAHGACCWSKSGYACCSKGRPFRCRYASCSSGKSCGRLGHCF